MSATDPPPAWAQRLTELRRARMWVESDLAQELKKLRPDLPSVKSLTLMIRSDWEAGRHRPGPRYRLLLATVYDVDEAELFGDQKPARPSLWRPSGLPEMLNGAFTPDDEERLIQAAQRPSRVDLRVIEGLGTILAAQRRTEDVIGSAPLVGPVRAQLATIEALVTDARGPIRPKVVNLGAQWAQFHGWLTANTGDLANGKAWLDRALEWALEADDVNLTSEVLSFKGHIAWMAEQVGPMIGLSAAALRGNGLYPGQYAIAAAQEARGHAMAGNAHEMEHKLDQTDQCAAAARERLEEAPPWLYYHSPGFFDLQRGLAYRYVGRRDPAYNLRAVEVLTAGLDGLPGDMRHSEWAGEFVYQLALAYAQGREIEEAKALAEDLSALAERIDSKRLTSQAAALL